MTNIRPLTTLFVDLGNVLLTDSDDQALFVEVAQSLGLHGIHHTGYASTRAALAALGLALPD
jgi:hypothetical protein